MTARTGATGNQEAARAVGRCYGALFFSLFGGAWFLLSAYAFGFLNRTGAVLIALATLCSPSRRFGCSGAAKTPGKTRFPRSSGEETTVCLES